MLASTNEELKKSQYAMKEKYFIISEQKKSGRENKLSADNRKVVDNYQAELSEQISNMFSMVASCLSQQNAQIYGVNKLSQSRLEAHNKAILEMKKKVRAQGIYTVLTWRQCRMY